MKHILIFLMFFAFTCNIQGQVKEITQAGNKYYLGDRLLSISDLTYLTQDVPEAYQNVKSAKALNIAGSIFGGIGGFCIGYPLGTALGGGEPNWTLAAVGAGFLIVGIPLAITANKRLKAGVTLYNDSLKEKDSSYVDLKFGLLGNGIGLQVRF